MQRTQLRRLIDAGRVGLATLVLVAAPGQAAAADRVAELEARLKTSQDFRLRTQAALALGVSADDRAVPVLCGALSDQNQTVRAAAAAALGKLARGGAKCLQDRVALEPSPKVKELLTKVLAKLPPERNTIGPETRYYVAIGPTTNKTNSPDLAVEQLVRSALEQALKNAGKLALAPVNETPKAAQEVLAAHTQLRPVYVWPKVQSTTAGGTVSLRLSLTLFSYPDKAFKGSLSQKLSLPGAGREDPGVLGELVQAGAPKLVTQLLAAVDQLK